LISKTASISLIGRINAFLLMSDERTLYLIILASGLLSLILVSTSNWNFIYAEKERFRANLEGDKEIPPVQSNAIAVAKFKVNGDTITYNINVSGISDATGAQIHKGSASKIGDTIVELLKAGNPSKTPTGMLIKGKFNASNLVGPMAGNNTSGLVSLLSTNNTYVQIQTTDHPDGEIRGQIKTTRSSNSTLPATVNATTGKM
jgi:CHRD domain